MIDRYDRVWDLDGNEKLDIWWSDYKITKYQTKYGIAYEMMHQEQCFYYSTRKGHGNMPYWEMGELPKDLIVRNVFFPQEDLMDDIVALEDTDDLIFSQRQ